MIKKAKVNKSEAKKRNRQYVLEYLGSHPCIDCGNCDVRVLEFDHVKGKKDRGISNIVLGGLSLDRLKREIEKCDVRCANCHRIKTCETLWNRYK